MDVRQQRPPQWLPGLAMDLLAWYCAPAAFLVIYVDRHFAPAEAIAPHLRVVLLPLLGLALARLTLSLPGIGASAARLATSLAAAALLGVMISYYGLVLIGLDSWGRVVSWDLIASYAGHAARLAEALGISMPVVIGATGLAYLALLAAVWAYLGRFDWPRAVTRRLSPPSVALLILAGAAIWAIELYNFRAGPPTQHSEPVSLTFYPLEGAWNYQGHAVDKLSAVRRDAAEDAARALYVPRPAAARRNVILIVVDALRADHMGIYGYARATTPNLARLEKAGILRKASSVRAACSSSVCGLLSIASSKFLHQFSRRPITLQEVLRRHGYRIHMVLSGDHTLFYGLKTAYGEVDSYFDARETRTLRYLNDDRLVLDHLSSFPAWDGEPVMMQLHLMSAHLLGWRDVAMAKYTPAANYGLINRDEGREQGRGINYYDNGVLQADATINAILETLERKGYLKNTVVAITADHGEALGEHGLYSHGNSVREEALGIPLVLLSYGYRPEHPIDGHVAASQVDIAPTLLAELGVPRPSTWAGMALQAPVAREFLYFQELWDVGLLDLRDPGNLWKYWMNTKTGEEHAYNLSLDPRERLNAIDQASAQQRRDWRLRALAVASVGAKRRPGPDPL